MGDFLQMQSSPGHLSSAVEFQIPGSGFQNKKRSEAGAEFDFLMSARSEAERC